MVVIAEYCKTDINYSLTSIVAGYICGGDVGFLMFLSLQNISLKTSQSMMVRESRGGSIKLITDTMQKVQIPLHMTIAEPPCTF